MEICISTFTIKLQLFLILFSKSKTLILNMKCRLVLNNRGIIEWVLDNFSMQETKVKKMNVVYKIL